MIEIKVVAQIYRALTYKDDLEISRIISKRYEQHCIKEVKRANKYGKKTTIIKKNVV